MYTFNNLDNAMTGMARTLLDSGQWRTVRGMRCLEIPHPVLIAITNPTDRYVTHRERQWNRYLPWAESLWMALGMNDLNALPGHYVKALYSYADDGHTWRGGYGPRIRRFSGIATDYTVGRPLTSNAGGYVTTVDQLRYVLEAIRRDPHTRQALIQIGDPVKDCFTPDGVLKQTKDFPCSRTLQFMLSPSGHLNLTLSIRSNDLMFGLSAVNTTNFTLMQEYVANLLGVEVGTYYTFIGNLHIYEPHHEWLVQLAGLPPVRTDSPTWTYKDRFLDLEHFDRLLTRLYHQERSLVSGEAPMPVYYNHDMVDDWLRVFWRHRLKVLDRRDEMREIQFANPHLNNLFA